MAALAPLTEINEAPRTFNTVASPKVSNINRTATCYSSDLNLNQRSSATSAASFMATPYPQYPRYYFLIVSFRRPGVGIHGCLSYCWLQSACSALLWVRLRRCYTQASLSGLSGLSVCLSARPSVTLLVCLLQVAVRRRLQYWTFTPYVHCENTSLSL